MLQKKAVRIMSFKDQYPILGGRLNPSNPLFKDLEILKIQDVYKLQVNKFIHDWMNLHTPNNFDNWFILNKNIHDYHTTSNVNIVMDNELNIPSVTNSNKLHIQGSNLSNYGAKRMKVVGPLMWNSLPETIRNCKSVNMFKHKLKILFLDKYSTPEIKVTGQYYVSKLSLCALKITCSKMKSFFVPNYLPNQPLRVCNLTHDGLKIKIFRK